MTEFDLLFWMVCLVLAAIIGIAILKIVSRPALGATERYAAPPPPRSGISRLAVESALIGAIAEVCALADAMLPSPPEVLFFGIVFAALAAVSGAVALDQIIRQSGRVLGEGFAVFGTISFLFVVLLTVPLPRPLNVPLVVITVTGGLVWGALDVVSNRRRACATGEIAGSALTGSGVEFRTDETWQEWLAAQTPEGAEGAQTAEQGCAAAQAKRPTSPPTLSSVAVASLGCGIVAVVLFPTALPALVGGIGGLVQIAVSRGRLCSAGFAIGGILFATYTFALFALSGK